MPTEDAIGKDLLHQLLSDGVDPHFFVSVQSQYRTISLQSLTAKYAFCYAFRSEILRTSPRVKDVFSERKKWKPKHVNHRMDETKEWYPVHIKRNSRLIQINPVNIKRKSGLIQIKPTQGNTSKYFNNI